MNDDPVAQAIIDLAWKVTPYTTDNDGFIETYIVPAGVMHRLIGVAQGAGIPAFLRSPQ